MVFHYSSPNNKTMSPIPLGLLRGSDKGLKSLIVHCYHLQETLPNKEARLSKEELRMREGETGTLDPIVQTGTNAFSLLSPLYVGFLSFTPKKFWQNSTVHSGRSPAGLTQSLLWLGHILPPLATLIPFWLVERAGSLMGHCFQSLNACFLTDGPFCL